MRYERIVKTQDTITDYYCDICGEQQFDSSGSYGGQECAYERLEKCFICGKDACPDCRKDLPEFDRCDICNECASEYKKLIEPITILNKEYYIALKQLKNKVVEKRATLQPELNIDKKYYT